MNAISYQEDVAAEVDTLDFARFKTPPFAVQTEDSDRPEMKEQLDGSDLILGC